MGYMFFNHRTPIWTQIWFKKKKLVFYWEGETQHPPVDIRNITLASDSKNYISTGKIWNFKPVSVTNLDTVGYPYMGCMPLYCLVFKLCFMLILFYQEKLGYVDLLNHNDLSEFKCYVSLV